MAGKGFAVMALAFYNYDDLPQDMDVIHLEYFEEALYSLLNYPQGITAADIINGSVANMGRILHSKDETLSSVGCQQKRIKVTKDGIEVIADVLCSPLEGPDQKSFIPVERSDTTFLFLVGQDDHNCKRPGPFSGIIDIYGVGGGLLEYRASLLAGHGFATLAVAFYNFEDLPKDDSNLRLDYFEESVCYMLHHPQVRGPGIGLLGISLGADICLSMASFLKNVSATVSINGSGTSGSKTIYYKQTTIPPLGHDLRKTKVTSSGILDIVDIHNDIVGGHKNPSMIPIEKAEGPILFIVGQDDHNWKSDLYAQTASERLQAHGKEKPQVFSYPGAGHYIEPPYFPMCPASLHKLVNKTVFWGGEFRAHSKAQVDAWEQILSFFYKHLGGTQNRVSPKL
ncbi:Acyl-coenzyme A thioesterase 4 [Fukomys damarensis]|uniref:Acyl-coenzyme A thioesterase 4 n=1 Tax=Fukomys damarensis TaxID=885580 RepID=A0A091D260_FUKDA|nr:Acyl-coenzyme A thioesterase 4 [Fukomys damarensis]